MITVQKVTSNVQSVPRQFQTFIETPNCVLEDRVQCSTVHILNVFCDGRLQLINCVAIVGQVHRDFLFTLYINPYFCLGKMNKIDIMIIKTLNFAVRLAVLLTALKVQLFRMCRWECSF
jgi:hypothetical protein